MLRVIYPLDGQAHQIPACMTCDLAILNQPINSTQKLSEFIYHDDDCDLFVLTDDSGVFYCDDKTTLLEFAEELINRPH